MCGIAGIYDASGRPVDRGAVERMISALRHRGPDDAGIHARGPVGLGHTRLSIIDLEGGAQPMPNGDGSLWIVFNGEIFNYRELREELLRRGHRFATQSDTEVILHLYEERGESCVEELNGQWAFAIWDSRRGALFLSRDRVGIRPLYYARRDGRFYFASEVKALYAHPELRRGIDLDGLDELFTYWCNVAPRTIFDGIEQLPPGHSMRVREDGVESWPYWELRFGEADASLGAEEHAARLRELLVDATRLRLRADVPVGAYLSGGLDSTTTVALIRQFTDAPLETFSVTFDDPDFDESSFQEDVVRRLGVRHHAVRCSHADIGDAFRDVVWHAESPLVRTAPAPLFLLSRLVRDCGFKVVVTGEGADEVLGGYDIFKEAKIRRFWSAQPGSSLRPLLLRRLYPYMRNIQRQPDAYRRAFFHVQPEHVSDPLFSHLPRWSLGAGIKRCYSKEARGRLVQSDPFARARDGLPQAYTAWGPFEQAQYLEATMLMPGYILSSQGDRMAMAHSVEGRFPFLDHRVVEYAARLPHHLKMRVLDEKHLLKRAFSDLVPSSVAGRPKQPYRAPDAVSLLGGEGGAGRPEWVDDVLSPRAIRAHGIFNPQAVERLLAKFEKGRAIGVRDNMALVGIVSTELLLHQFVDTVGS